ncbi:hypothetical protein DFH08DRAFT_941901 [Mycena albidolilacea]|uniref:Transmembrane protein n=1 Tax=Mycena albidolilacea TaxID=1033008 RepID=A0AAD6ZGT1_9AGAR|nr:hypothetical protein DFH08DRAFT_941901 [Mycena albidolilacea]
MTIISLARTELIAPIITCVFYGIYLVTLGIAGRQLLTTETGQWKQRPAINWVIVGVSVVLFVNSTLNLVVVLITIYQAFVLYKGPGGPDHIFMHGSGWKTITKSVNVPLQSLVGDGILIYRCWIVCNKSWLIVALPLLIWLANITCAIRLVDLITQGSEGLIIGQLLLSKLIPQNKLFALIVVRIWMVERQNRQFRGSGVGTGVSSQNYPRSTLSHAMRNIIDIGDDLHLLFDLHARHLRPEEQPQLPYLRHAPGTVGDSATTVGDNEGVFRFSPFDKEGNSTLAEAV